MFLRASRLPHSRLPLSRLLSSSPPPPSQSLTNNSTKRTEAEPSEILESRLPRAKLRALISLYHETESFITPQNLDQIIDQKFATPLGLSASRYGVSLSYFDLQSRLRTRRSAPRHIVPREWGGSSLDLPRNNMFETDRRGLDVAGALLGVDHLKKASLETLEENVEHSMDPSTRAEIIDDLLHQAGVTSEDSQEQMVAEQPSPKESERDREILNLLNKREL